MFSLGFLKKKEPFKTFTVQLSRLPAWLEEEAGEDIKSKGSEAEGLYQNVIDRLNDTKQSLENLDKVRLTGAERLHVASNMIKESFVKKKYSPLASLAALHREFRSDYEYFNNFQQKAMEAIEELKGSTPRQTIMISHYFRRESEVFVDALKKAEEANTRLGEFLREGAGPLKLISSIRASAEANSRLSKELSDLESRAASLEGQIAALREKKSELEKEYLRILKSREWGELNSIEKKMSEARQGLAESESLASGSLSSVRKQVKSVEKFLSNAGKLTPIQRNALRDFIRDPMKLIDSDKTAREIASSLKSASKLSKGTDTLKDVDIGSALDKLQSEFPRLREDYLKRKASLESMEKEHKELSKIASKKSGMEEDVKSKAEEIGRLDDELSTVRARKASTKESLEAGIRELEALIFKESQKKVVIRD